MEREIERKFLVVGDSWRAAAGAGDVCCQGYISSGMSGATVRIRLLGGRGFITIKGPSEGLSRPEMEYEIPAGDAEYMLENLCGDRRILKNRHTLEVGGMTWEIDEFSGLNEGLIVAEIELENETQYFPQPEWLGEEVTFDLRYTNAALARHPFAQW